MNLTFRTTSRGLLGRALFLFFISARALADSYYVEPVTGPGAGLSEGDLNTTTELVRAAVARLQSEPAAESTPGVTVASDSSSADYALRARVFRLGGSVVLSMQKLKGGKPVFSADMKAAKIEDLDQVADRLTRVVVLSAGLGDEGDRVQGAKARKKALSGSYAGVGAAWMSGLNASNVAVRGEFGHFWDVNDFMVKLGTDLTTTGDALMAVATLGGHYFFSDRSTTPYIGAGFGFGVAKASSGAGFFTGESGVGFAFNGGAGFQFFRTSSINLDLGARASILLRSFSTGTPLVYGLVLSLYY